MWGSRGRQDEVTCIACDATVERSAAREYDKHGDRFERQDKNFEYLCKPCHRELCHQPRGDLERTLMEAGAGKGAREDFLERYTELAAGGREEHGQE